MNPPLETPPSIACSPQDLHKLEFFLLRESRNLIKYAALNAMLPMPRKPAPERTDPVQEILYRRAGLRLVEHASDSAFVDR